MHLKMPPGQWRPFVAEMDDIPRRIGAQHTTKQAKPRSITEKDVYDVLVAIS